MEGNCFGYCLFDMAFRQVHVGEKESIKNELPRSWNVTSVYGFVNFEVLKEIKAHQE